MAVLRTCAPRALLAAAARTSEPPQSICPALRVPHNIRLGLVHGAYNAHTHMSRAALRNSRTRAADVVAPTVQQVAEDGDYVEVHFTGTLDDGTVFDSSRDREPLPFVVAAGSVVPGFDIAVKGLAVGGTRTQRVEPADAYGLTDCLLNPYHPPTCATPPGMPREELIAQVPNENAPEGLELMTGMRARVTAMDEEAVTIDANHELAGKPLTFEVELMALTKANAMQRATFGMGCFWGPELTFQRVKGVLSTSVGYCNGSHPNPTYEDVCSGTTGHAEVVQVLFDPAQVGYEALLDVFFNNHDPTQENRQGNDVGTQYRSGIYTHTPEQLEAATKAVKAASERLGAQVMSDVEPVDNFHAAEDYHQSYLSRGGRFGRPQSAAKGCTDPIRCYG